MGIKILGVSLGTIILITAAIIVGKKWGSQIPFIKAV